MGKQSTKKKSNKASANTFNGKKGIVKKSLKVNQKADPKSKKLAHKPEVVQKKKDKNAKQKKSSRKVSPSSSPQHKSIAEVLPKKKPSKADLKAIIAEMKNDDVKLVIVRTALKYIPHYLKSTGLTKRVIKEVIRLWSVASEKIRVICLLFLIRIYTKIKDKQLKETIVKKLYSSFLEKCRITKQETMSMIGFMRHSLIELYKLDSQIAFKQAQLAVQQLSITLKQAKTNKNEETLKSVLNWQYANCLILLSTLITSNDSQILSLTNQVIQLNLDAIDLITSPRYYGFYCHLIENLIKISTATGLFIPVLPIIVGFIDGLDIPRDDIDKKKKDLTNGSSKAVNKNKSRNSDGDSDEEDDDDDDSDIGDEFEDDDIRMGDDYKTKEDRKKTKSYNMNLLNHVSHEEAHAMDYKEAVLGKLYELLVRYLASQSHRIAFPELTLLSSVQLKKWFKRNHGPKTQIFKTLLDKIKVDSEIIEERRKSIDFVFNNYAAVDAWEKKTKDSNKLSLPKLLSTIDSSE